MKMKRMICSLVIAAVALSTTVFGLTGCKSGPKGEGITTSEGTPDDPDFFCVDATGSKYATGIKLPKLENPKLSIMMSINWEAIDKQNTEDNPLAQWHSTKIWKEIYGTDIEIVMVTEDQQTSQLATMAAAGNTPDIIPGNENTYPLWTASGLTQDMSKYADYMDLNNKEVFNLDLMNLFKWNGEYHGAVTLDTVNRSYIVYNETMFKAKREKTPMEHYLNNNWTWTQFVKTAKAMTDGTNYGFTGWGLFPYFAPYPMVTLDREKMTASLNTKDSKYMRYMTEVYNFYQKEKAGRLDYELQNWASLFPKSVDAMVMVDFPAYRRIVTAAENIQGDTFRIAPMPIMDVLGETEVIAPSFVWTYSISSAAQNPTGAATYIRLETLVGKNIDAAQPEFGSLENVLTADEKTMIRKYQTSKYVIDPVRAIGTCYSLVDTELVPQMYYATTEASVQSMFDAIEPKLQAQITEFNEIAANK